MDGSSTMKQRDTILRYSAAFFLTLLTFIVYLPALQNGFINWDDNIYIFENQKIRSFDLDFISWSLLPNEIGGHWHPLTWFSLALDYALWGLDPKGFHLTNVILHSLNTLLVFILAVRLIGVNGSESAACSPLLTANYELRNAVAAFVTALLFGIHPMRVESVAWATERKDVLSLFFFLMTLLSYLRYNSTTGSKRRFYFIACLILFTMSLMAKSMAVTLPVVLLILDFYPLRRFKKDGRLVFVEKIPFFLLSLGTSLLTLWSAGLAGSIENKDFTFITRLFISARGYIFYLVKMAFPVDLAPIYPYPAKVNILTFEYLGSALLILSMTIYCLWALRRGRLLFSVWMYYIITLLPVIGIVHTGQQDTADRYTYMPSIGPFLLAGIAVGNMIERNSKRLLPVAAALLILTGFLIDRTIKQIRVWHDPITLWTHEVRLFPDASVAHGNLSVAYANLGNYLLALREINKAIEVDKSYVEGYDYRGRVYYWLGNYQQAINNFNKAIEIKPEYVSPYINRGYVYSKMGNYMQSIKDLKKAIELDPENKKANDNLGMVYSQMGDNRQALIYYKKAAALGSRSAQEYLNKYGR